MDASSMDGTVVAMTVAWHEACTEQGSATPPCDWQQRRLHVVELRRPRLGSHGWPIVATRVRHRAHRHGGDAPPRYGDRA